MNAEIGKEQIREALAALIAAHKHSVMEIELAIQGLSSLLDAGMLIEEEHRRGRRTGDRPWVDRETLSIVWGEKRCFLGNTLPLLFFERLARSPNRYVSHADLMEEVWGGDREPSTIRGVAKRLRDRLHAEGMERLADAIDGSVTGYYGLKSV